MRRWAAALVVMALATLVVVQGTGAVGIVLWEMVVTLALLVVWWRRWPRSHGGRQWLFGGESGFGRRPPGRLASLELEVIGATDDRLGDPRLRARLMSLAEHRAGQATLSEAEGRRLLGAEAWQVLAHRRGALNSAEVETLVERIEAI